MKVITRLKVMGISSPVLLLVVGGLSALGCAMLELGVDRSNAIKYEVALMADQFLLIVHGSEAEIQHARSLLEGPKKQLTYEHQVPDETTGSIIGSTALI